MIGSRWDAARYVKNHGRARGGTLESYSQQHRVAEQWAAATVEAAREVGAEMFHDEVILKDEAQHRAFRAALERLLVPRR